MNTSTFSLRDIIVSIFGLALVVLVIFGVNNFFKTQEFIRDSNVQIELFNEVFKYTPNIDGSTTKVIPENFHAERKNVFIEKVSGEGNDFIAAAYDMSEPTKYMYCYDSKTYELYACNLGRLA